MNKMNTNRNKIKQIILFVIFGLSVGAMAYFAIALIIVGTLVRM